MRDTPSPQEYFPGGVWRLNGAFVIAHNVYYVK